jgi:hypothetical protein
MAKQPFTHASAQRASECKSVAEPDTVTTASGKHYDVTGPLKDVITADLANLSGADFETKWVSVLRTPESARALGLAA